jgi:hypothetical protein
MAALSSSTFSELGKYTSQSGLVHSSSLPSNTFRQCVGIPESDKEEADQGMTGLSDRR